VLQRDGTSADAIRLVVAWRDARTRVAPGQSLVFYDERDETVLGGGLAALA
jgi:tRNA U34 2-thiouridine synthase MnmA/TrmU